MHAGNGQHDQIDKSRQLQRKLYLAAKKCRNRRFHALYDRIFRPDILWRARQEVKANGGSAGVDDVSLEEVERQGVASFLEAIAAGLKAGRYHVPRDQLLELADVKRHAADGVVSKYSILLKMWHVSLIASLGFCRVWKRAKVVGSADEPDF